MDIQNSLEKAIQAFYITAQNGVSFWAPYLRNDNHSQDPNVPRGLGKASPEEIKRAADYITTHSPDATSEEIRQKLVDGKLPENDLNYKGIDCSGFIYFVMDKVYKSALNKELLDDLSVSKEQVLNGAFKFEEWMAVYKLNQAEADALPEDVPVRWVVETFKRKAVNLCPVAGLMSDYSSINVPVGSVKIGDLVNMAGHTEHKAHAALVCKIGENTIDVAHSNRKNPSEVGGVLVETLRYDNDKIWTEEMSTPHDFLGIRRLKSLAQI